MFRRAERKTTVTNAGTPRFVIPDGAAASLACGPPGAPSDILPSPVRAALCNAHSSRRDVNHRRQLCGFTPELPSRAESAASRKIVPCSHSPTAVLSWRVKGYKCEHRCPTNDLTELHNKLRRLEGLRTGKRWFLHPTITTISA